jgi:hypothetical protein
MTSKPLVFEEFVEFNLRVILIHKCPGCVSAGAVPDGAFSY